MELKEVIKKRRSVRDYEDLPVPEDKLLRVLDAARLAPSGANRQPWKFIVVRDIEKRQQLAQAAEGQTFVAEAPVYYCCSSHNAKASHDMWSAGVCR